MKKTIEYYIRKYMEKAENIESIIFTNVYLDSQSYPDKYKDLCISFQKNSNTPFSRVRIPIGTMKDKEGGLNKIYAKLWIKKIDKFLDTHDTIQYNEDVYIIQNKIAKKFMSKMIDALDSDVEKKDLQKYFDKNDYGIIKFGLFEKTYNKIIKQKEKEEDYEVDR